MTTRFCIPALLLAVAIAGCDSSTGNEQRVPARLDVVSGDAQSGTVGTELAQPLVVKVVDANGKAVKNQLVNFVVVSGGGHVFAGSALTGSDGTARERWTLGTVAADSQKVEARAVDATGAPIVFATFRATATPGAPATVSSVGGTTRTGAVGGLVSDSAAVKVSDQYGNGVAGVAVAWTADAGGTTSPASTPTNASGIAKTGWTLALRADTTYHATATASGATVVFTATPTIPASAVLEKVSGDNQTVQAGSAPLPLVARLRLADGRPVQGATVDYGGPVLKTDATGQVMYTPSAFTFAPNVVTWTATVAGLPPVTFTVTWVPGPGVLTATQQISYHYTACGDASTATWVMIRDTFNNVIPGAAINYAVTAGGGSVSPATVTSDANGRAQTHWTLGFNVGINELTVSSPAATNQVKYTVTAEAGPVAFAVVTPDTLHVAVGSTGSITGVSAKDVCGNEIPVGARLGTGWSFSYGASTPSPNPYFSLTSDAPNGHATVQALTPGSAWVIGTFHHLGASASDSTFVIVQ